MGKSKKAALPKRPFGVTEEFVDLVNSSSSDQLKGMIVQIQKDLDDAKEWLEQNEEIIRLKGEIDLIAGPTRDTKKSLKNRTKHIIDALKEKGAI